MGSSHRRTKPPFRPAENLAEGIYPDPPNPDSGGTQAVPMLSTEGGSAAFPPEQGRRNGGANPPDRDAPDHTAPFEESSWVPPESGFAWWERLFSFARELKGRPELASADPAALSDEVLEWFDKEQPDEDFLVVFSEFRRAWEKVKFPVGHRPFDKALERARADPVNAAFRGCGVVLLSLCRELQLLAKASGRRTFFLGCREAGAAVGVTHQSAWEMLGSLEALGWIKKTKNGKKATKNEKGRASEWVYRKPRKS